jgi:hypothetical protein
MGRSSPRDSVDTLRDRLQDGDRGPDDQAREKLLEMSDNLDLIPSEVGAYRHRDLLRRCTIMAEEGGVEHAPVTCPRCTEETPREYDNCIHCNQSLDLRKKELLDDVVERLEDGAVDADDPEERAGRSGPSPT